jgi:hypothetical protein
MVLFTTGAPTIPQKVEAPVLVIPEMLLLVMFTFGDVQMIPAVLNSVPVFDNVEIVLLVIVALVTLAPAWKLIPITAALAPVFVVAIPEIVFPETVALSDPAKIAIPIGTSALASEMLPTLLFEIVTPLAP